MGAGAEVRLYCRSRRRADELFELVFAEIERIEKELSSFLRTSEISRINRQAGRQPVVTDPETFDLLRLCVEISRDTNGAFDITLGRLRNAWGFFRSADRYPSSAELRAARRDSGWAHLALDPRRRSVEFRRAALELDLGGIGKGFALDAAAALLRGAGATNALLGLGRSSYCAVGAPPDSDGWPIDIRAPSTPGRLIATVALRDRSLSTSGSAASFFELQGRSYSHIIDPRSGGPAKGMAQVTVLAATATMSDALSTALFVLGAAGTEALRTYDGAALLIAASDTEPAPITTIDWPTEVAVAR